MINSKQRDPDSKLPDNLLKPPIIEPGEYPVFMAGMDYRQARKTMEKGSGILVKGSFATALKFYSWVKSRIIAENPVRDFVSSGKTKKILRESTGKILVRVTRHRIDLEKAPPLPWLGNFYPDDKDFLISLSDLLGMNGAWQWYEKGISYPWIPGRLHPFYGVYFPVRTAHLDLFDRWLARKGKYYATATDMGTGCGILGFIMATRGIEKIHGTDTNPNAVYSTAKEIERRELQHRFMIEQAPFFGSSNQVDGLAVFNPPWIPGTQNSITDTGIYYDPHLFDQLLYEAETKLVPGATMVIIFSNFAIEAGITVINPVEETLGRSKKFTIAEKITAKAREKVSGRPEDWLERIREKEMVELWILKRLNK
jgi:hypothetical protein